MPIGILRLNARHQQPNAHISFIKALPGPTATQAEEFLSRVAAISVPIMRVHHLAITTLEEHEPNREFIGRNFNNGEVVQLVLRTRAGGWMSFRSVVLVLMHELAHNGQMNHGREFWKLNDCYKEEMRKLWIQGYYGEGVWGQGRALDSESWEAFQGAAVDDMPANLCGGTYRSRRRKRREPKQLSYQERKERRIMKKFGAGGVQLGGDEEVRTTLEKQSRKGNPRVAKSARGRELRAAAALKRFQVPKEEPDVTKTEDGAASEHDSDYEDEDTKGELALDTHGHAMLDGKGNAMIKVEDEDAADFRIKDEMQELQDLNAIPAALPEKDHRCEVKKEAEVANQHRNLTSSPQERSSREPVKLPASKTALPPPAESSTQSGGTLSNGHQSSTTESKCSPSGITACPICSAHNDLSSLLCSTCSHVLDARKSPAAWSCERIACRATGFLNSADYGLCGLCGASKPCV